MADIVIGMDSSPGAAAALRWAVREAELRGWQATALLAWGLLDQHHPSGERRFDPDYGEDDALEALDAAIDRAVGPEIAPTVRRRAVCDLPARALLDAADEAELLVVGARGLGGFSRLLLGSVSEHCLNHARRPVAVVRATDTGVGEPGGAGGAGRAEPPERGRVVVGVDGSDDGQRALGWALDEARARRATVEVVHAWQPAFLAGYPFAPVAVDDQAYEEAARRVVDAALESSDTTGLARPVERTLVTGGAAASILDAAEGADLVVVGSRGTGGFRGLLLGSVSQQVARHAPCPAVVVRPHERDHADRAE